MDYRIFNARTWSFLCVRHYTHGVWAHRQPVSTTFLTRKKLSQTCSCAPNADRGFELWAFRSRVRRSTNWATLSPTLFTLADAIRHAAEADVTELFSKWPIIYHVWNYRNSSVSLCIAWHARRLCETQSKSESIANLQGCLLGGVYVPCIIYHMPSGVIVGDSGLCFCGLAFNVCDVNCSSALTFYCLQTCKVFVSTRCTRSHGKLTGLDYIHTCLVHRNTIITRPTNTCT